MNRLLRSRVPLAVIRILAGLLITGCVGLCVFVVNLHNDTRFAVLQSEADLALPFGSSREQVKAWLDSRELPYQPIYDKGGDVFLWYLVRMKSGSYMRPQAEYWMQFSFEGTANLKRISAGED